MIENMPDILVMMEITLFFQRNPYCRETLQGLARRIGREINYVDKEVEKLVERKILVKTGSGNKALYRYQEPYFDFC